ncbi:hypothetical protein KP509_15G064900 [Ceratopteris richardii]|uniref:Uncharacterized protein n=1 Tax=Ceratopteris richardii TaxID=49495 RepID=A0A8T2T5J2_CERRI|nr:hypothetical protein KP509_15G064900 [Ceratopteris richardii]
MLQRIRVHLSSNCVECVVRTRVLESMSLDLPWKLADNVFMLQDMDILVTFKVSNCRDHVSMSTRHIYCKFCRSVILSFKANRILGVTGELQLIRPVFPPPAGACRSSCPSKKIAGTA